MFKKSEKADLSKAVKSAEKTNRQEFSRNKIVIAIAVVLTVAAIMIVAAVMKNKIQESRYKNEYVTAESDITMQTAAEGETELITDQFGNELVVKEDGVYKKSDFGDSYEKMMNLKVVPLVGKWGSDSTATTYEFFEDGTFQITIPYDNGDGNIQEAYYKGKVVIHEDYRTAFPKFGCGNLALFLKKQAIDEKSFVEKNLYYVSLHYSTISDSESNEVYTASETEFETLPDEPDAAFDGILYTYWLEDINAYKMKVCSQSTGETVVFTKIG